MALRALRNWLCSCGQLEQETDTNVIQGETSRLIPDTLRQASSPPSFSVSFGFLAHCRVRPPSTIVDSRKGLERLSERKKGPHICRLFFPPSEPTLDYRKMVNVGSHIPFNLHNQPLPPDFHHNHRPHLLPRSPSSGYFDHSIDDEYTENNRYINYEQDPYPPTPYPQFHSSSPRVYGATDHGSRSPSPDREPRTILNVRLVGFSDRRGRSTQRKNLDSDDTRDHTPRPSELPHDSSNGVVRYTHSFSLLCLTPFPKDFTGCP